MVSLGHDMPVAIWTHSGCELHKIKPVLKNPSWCASIEGTLRQEESHLGGEAIGRLYMSQWRNPHPRTQIKF